VKIETMLISIILILVIIVFVTRRARRNTPEYKGKKGERRVRGLLAQLPEDYTIMNDVVLKTASGTTQIDHVVVSKYGIFAIETKNYRGEIYGDDYREQWTQIIVTKVTYRSKWWKTYSYVTKNLFYNPVKQSLSHVNAIKKAIKDYSNINVVPIVVFVGDAVLSKVTTLHHVIHENLLLETIKNHKVPYISDSEVARLVSCLAQKNIRRFVDDRTHINNVYAAERNYNNKIASGVCPQCGGTLIKRKGKYGDFYGCSNYPNCMYTKQ